MREVGGVFVREVVLIRAIFSFAWIIDAALIGYGAPPPLEVVAQLNDLPGNIAVTPSGRVIISLHQFAPSQYRVAEVGKDGALSPFPNATMNSADKNNPLTLDTVLGIQADAQGRVWMLDNAMLGKTTPKLVAWDTKADELARVIYLPPPLTAANSFVNDLAVDLKHDFVYIADPAGGQNAALIVIDLKTGVARRVLEGAMSVSPEDVDLVIDGRAIEVKRPDGSVTKPRAGVNPIALDATCEWLYYGALTGKTLYRIPTAAMRNPSLADANLVARVQRYCERPLCDGIAMDDAGYIYISDIASNAVGVINSERAYRQIYVDAEKLSWPDAFSVASDYVYVVANQLQRAPFLNGGENGLKPPYYVLRFPVAQKWMGRE